MYRVPAALRPGSALAVLLSIGLGVLLGLKLSGGRPLAAALVGALLGGFLLLYLVGSNTTVSQQGLRTRWFGVFVRSAGWPEVVGITIAPQRTRAVRVELRQGRPLSLAMLMVQDPDLTAKLERIKSAWQLNAGLPDAAPRVPAPRVLASRVLAERPVLRGGRATGRLSGYWQGALGLLLAAVVVLGLLPGIRHDRADLAVYRSSPPCGSLAVDPPHCQVTETVSVDHVAPGRSGNGTAVYLDIPGSDTYEFTLSKDVRALDAIHPGAELTGSWVTGIDCMSVSYQGVGYDEGCSPPMALDDDYRLVGVMAYLALFFGLWSAVILRGRRRPLAPPRHWILALFLAQIAAAIAVGADSGPLSQFPWLRWAWGPGVGGLVAAGLLARQRRS